MLFWIFPVVLCHAFCMWHWTICKNWNLTFIWGHHHLHLVDDLTSLFATPSWRDLTKVETAVHGCNSWLSVWTLSCRFPVKLLHSISAASLFASRPSLSIFGLSDLLQILRKTKAFSFAVLYNYIIVFRLFISVKYIQLFQKRLLLWSVMCDAWSMFHSSGCTMIDSYRERQFQAGNK